MASTAITHQALRDLAEERLREARALRDAGLHDGALYLAGYVVELALKACVCKRLGSAEYPPEFERQSKLRDAFLTHSLTDLVVVAALLPIVGIRSSPQQDPDGYFATNYGKIIENRSWSEKLRYRSLGTDRATEAEEFLSALDNPAHGVFTWLKTQW